MLAHVAPVFERARVRLSQVTSNAIVAAAQAPGRVNLIGEHTDYSGGFVMPIAIDRVCVAVAAASADRRLRIAFADHPEIVDLDPGDLQLPNLAADRGSPRGYVRGVVRAFQSRGTPVPHVSIAIASSVPLGGGLSSSASLEIALATLLAKLTHAEISPDDLADIGRAAEHDFAGVPCGIMDQTVSAKARAGHAMLLDCRSSVADHVPIPAGVVIAVIDTGVRHSLAAGEYAVRRRWCEEAAKRLGAASLREVTDQGGLERVAASSLTGDLLAAARHVVSENLRTLAAASALRRGGIAEVGLLMNASHDSLRDDFRVSCPELDAAVDIARTVPGVYGARMTGGGFGGCAIALCTPDAAHTLDHALASAYNARTARQHRLFTTVASAGASTLL
jgi:galactokinase